MITDSMRNSKVYNGAYDKFGISIKGKDYIVKGNDEGIFAITEYIASTFIGSFNIIPCQKVLLDFYRGNLVCVIEDFCDAEEFLHSFKSTKQSSEDTLLSDKEYNYKDVIYLIEKHLKMSEDAKELAIKYFWWMFIFDALLGNRDRHWGNWGYIADSNGNYRPSPLYDNAGSLYPNFFSGYKGGSSLASDYSNDSYSTLKREVINGVPSQLLFKKKESRYDRGNYYEIFSDLRVNKRFGKYVNQFRNNTSYKDIFDRIFSNYIQG